MSKDIWQVIVATVLFLVISAFSQSEGFKEDSGKKVSKTQKQSHRVVASKQKK